MLKNALLVTASIIVGAGGVQLLHAQPKAPAYFLGAINAPGDRATARHSGDELGSALPAVPRRQVECQATA
jgi:hypothetical protein